MSWDWKKPKGHGDQPLVEWWFEQVALYLVTAIAVRAHRRSDWQTFDRLKAIVRAGAKAERAES